MAVEQRGSAEGELEVDLRSDAERTEVGAAKRLGDDVCKEDWSALLDDGKAASVDRDAAANFQMAGDPGVIDAQTVGIRQDDLGDRANYSGEHPHIRASRDRRPVGQRPARQ